MRNHIGILAGIALMVSHTAALAWSDHANLLWPLVRSMPVLVDSRVAVESLASFVEAEAAGLESLLDKEERAAREALPHYAPRPDNLRFHAEAADLRLAFLEALRVNPQLPYRLYRHLTVEEEPPVGAQLWSFTDLSFLVPGEDSRRNAYLSLQPGAMVAPAHVVASANDEPDLGMDVGLYNNNDTSYGQRYGFGIQPFGNPNLDYGSQAPFHMGFYHLDWLTRQAQPDLQRALPAWRIDLYGALSEFAFSTGHDYWGWRFAGWALHYIGDLTQPYHADPLPGVSTPDALWLVVQGKTDEAIQLVSNRHGVLESYQYQRVMRDLESRLWDSAMLTAISQGAPVPLFEDTTVRTVLTAESTAAGEAVDATLEQHVPARFVSDPEFEWVGSGEESRVVDTVRDTGGSAAVAALDTMVETQMRRFSRYARAWINRTLDAAER